MDESSIQTIIADNFVVNSSETIDSSASSTAEYNSTKSYYPHIITLEDPNTLKDQNISIAKNTLTASGVEADTTKTFIRATTGSRVLKKTEQIKSYDEHGVKAYHQSTKDDGYYQSGVTPHYSRDDSKDVVTDHITGLEWQDNNQVTKNSDNWDKAISYCDKLSLDGDNWRLPTRKELVGLSDNGRTKPAINPTFKQILNNGYWSSTEKANDGTSAWSVFFSNGNQANYSKSNSYYIRCVRTGLIVAPSASFTRDTATQIVTDDITKLQWQDDVNVSKSWKDSLTYCEELTLGTHNDWRLPNIKELTSIVDDTTVNPSIDSKFKNIEINYYWSSTTLHKDDFKNAWNIRFGYGSQSFNDKNSGCYVRCVRDEK